VVYREDGPALTCYHKDNGFMFFYWYKNNETWPILSDGTWNCLYSGKDFDVTWNDGIYTANTLDFRREFVYV
jgi:hypothetical protein